jgi:hypothetical protein
MGSEFVEKVELKVEANKLIEGGGISVNHVGVGTEAVPIYINVDTGVDYAGITTAIIGFAVAIVVGWFTISVQRNQIQANLSNFRHQWMVELRQCASELLQLFLVMANKASRSEKYRSNGDYYSDRSRAAQLNAKLALLMSRDDAQSKNIRQASAKILDGLRDLTVGGDRLGRFKEISALQELLRKELESAWGDTKNDLGVGRRLVGGDPKESRSPSS